MSRPVIGLTTYREEAAWGVWHQRADLLHTEYADTVVAAGGVPVLLPPGTDDPDAAAVVIARIDGLIVSGGADVDPARYDAEPHDRTAGWRPDRDAWELALLEAAASADLPVLGVCRGMQVMAVVRDGEPQTLGPQLAFTAGDFVYFLTRPAGLAYLSGLFDPHHVPDRLEEHRYFGDFLLHGDALLGDLASVYDLPIEPGDANKSLAEFLARRFHGRAVVGDRASFGSAEIVVREVENGTITRVGLRLPMPQEGLR